MLTIPMNPTLLRELSVHFSHTKWGDLQYPILRCTARSISFNTKRKISILWLSSNWDKQVKELKDVSPHRDQEFILCFISCVEQAPLPLASSASETRKRCSEWLLRGFIFLQGNSADYLITLYAPLRQGEMESCASGVMKIDCTVCFLLSATTYSDTPAAGASF